jgi:hypothetical protein
MKKFFLLAAAAVVAFASCSKNDQPEQREAAIAFSSYAGRAISKADGSFIKKGTTELPAESKFGVWAYATGANPFDGTNTSNVFMNNVEVTYAGGGKTDETKYTYSPLRYWPNDEANNKLSFFAVYPYGATGLTAPANGWGAYTFTAQTAPASMVDFLFSEVAKDQTYSATNSGKKGVVNMKFHHALSMVKFKVNTDANYGTDTKITLKSIKVAAVKTAGTFTPQTASPFGVWSAQGTPAEFTVFNGTKQLTTVKPNADFLPTGTEATDAFLMVPQDLGDDVVVTVVYTVQTGTDAEVTNTATVKLNTAQGGSPLAAITKWAMNQNTVYTFTIGLKPIQFTADVVDWDAETVSGITIPAA